MTQCEDVVRYIEKHGSITQNDADLFGCKRLASRITDLRAKGFPIVVEIKPYIKTNGKKTRYAEYRFADNYDKDKVIRKKGAIFYEH